MKKNVLVILSILLVVVALFFIFFRITPGGIITLGEYNRILREGESKKVLYEAINSGDEDAALEIAMQRAQQDSSSVEIQLDLATAYIEKGNNSFEEEKYSAMALNIVSKIISDDPTNVEAYLIRGYAYEMVGNYNEAIDNYNQALDLENSSIGLNKRGHAYELMGDAEKAKKDYLDSYEMDNGNDAAALNMARVYFANGDLVNAEKFANHVLEISQHSQILSTAYNILANILIGAGKYEDAVETMQLAVSTDDTYHLNHENLAFAIYSEQADLDNYSNEKVSLAEQSIEDALKLFPESSFAYYVKALLQDLRGDSNAKATFLKAQSMIQDDITITAGEKEDFSKNITSIVNTLK